MVLDFIDFLAKVNSEKKQNLIEKQALENRKEHLDNLYRNGSSDVKNALDTLMKEPEVWDVILDKKFRVAVSTIGHDIAEKDGMIEEPLYEILKDENYPYLTGHGHRYATMQIVLGDREWYIEYDHYTTLFYIAPVSHDGNVIHTEVDHISDIDYID